MLHLEYDITKLRGAEYNPRKIGGDDLAALAESIETLGLIKPLIVRGDLLVAGHQRTKALRKLGRTVAPVYVLPAHTTVYDEVRFNQLHNGTDLDGGDEAVMIEGGVALGYQVVTASRVTGNLRAKMAPVRKEIADLITAYGPWGGVVATASGRVIHCAQYALAAIMTGTPLTVYGIADEREDEYRARLDRQYGVFCYDGLKRETYIQTFAQMMRLREGPSGKGNRSQLYDLHVIPWIEGGQRGAGIDFGSGQGDYAMALRNRGFDLHDVELFRRSRGAQAIDMVAINRMIDGMVRRLEQEGPYDFVICDAVLNSVDSLDAEAAVMGILNLLCKPGGDLFVSGRKLERVEGGRRHTQAVGDHRYLEFLDSDGFSALFRKGRWFYQKFHDGAQVEALLERFGFAAIVHDRSSSSTAFQMHARKVRDVSLQVALSSVEFEFDLPVSDDRRIGRVEDVSRATRAIYDRMDVPAARRAK